MSNLLSELCEQIDKLVIHLCTMSSLISEKELAAMYKQNIKKLLIKYEAKDSPNMKINELSAEINALKGYVDQTANTLIHRMDCENKRLKEIINAIMKDVAVSLNNYKDLSSTVQGIDNMQDEDSDRIDKLEEVLDEMREEHCEAVLPKNATISERVSAIKYLSVIDSLKKLSEFIANNRVTDIMIFEKIQNILKGLGEL